MSRLRYWINTFYSYIFRDIWRIFLSTLVGGISLYLLVFSVLFLKEAYKSKHYYRVFITVSNKTPHSDFTRIQNFLRSSENNIKLKILSPVEKLKKLSIKSEEIEKILPYTIIAYSSMPLKLNFPSDLKAFIIRVTSTPPGEKEFRRVLSVVRNFFIFLSISLLFGTILIIILTLHLSFISHIEEIKTLQMLGANRTFINIPLYFEGIFTGITSSIIAILMFLATEFLLKRYYPPLLVLLNGIEYDIISISSGILLGIAGSFLGTIFLLRMEEAS